jgi:hypothetical protein
MLHPSRVLSLPGKVPRQYPSAFDQRRAVTITTLVEIAQSG